MNGSDNGGIANYSEDEAGILRELSDFRWTRSLAWQIFGLSNVCSALINVYFSAVIALGLRRNLVPEKRFYVLLSISLVDICVASGMIGLSAMKLTLSEKSSGRIYGWYMIVCAVGLVFLMDMYGTLCLLQFIAVKFPLFYKVQVTPNRILKLIGLFFVLEMLLCVIGILVENGCDEMHDFVDASVHIGVPCFGTVCAVIILVYFFTMLTVFPPKIPCLKQSTHDWSPAVSYKNRRVFFRRLGVHIVVFLCSVLPIIGTMTYFIVSDKIHYLFELGWLNDPRLYLEHEINLTVWKVLLFSKLMFSLRAIIDPILYLWMEEVLPALPWKMQRQSSELRPSRPLMS